LIFGGFLHALFSELSRNEHDMAWINLFEHRGYFLCFFVWVVHGTLRRQYITMSAGAAVFSFDQYSCDF
jgi:hypothetical protein